ncbi:MAG: hypothetical protein Kow0047_04800 [Anaerolineae bacterium]
MEHRSEASAIQRLYQLGLRLGNTLDLHHEAHAFVSWLADVARPQRCALFIIDLDRTHMMLAASLGYEELEGATIPLGVDPWGWLAEAAEPSHLGSCYALPVITENQLCGVLCVVSAQEGEALAVEQQLLATATNFLAPVLRNIERYRSLEQLVAERTEALRRSEARYRAIVQDQSDLICRFLPDGTLTFVNDAYCQTFAKHAEELLGRSFTELMPDEEREKFAQLVQLMARDDSVQVIEHRSRRRDGREFWIQWVLRGLRDAEGRPFEIQAVGRDITERKRAEETLSRYVRRLSILRELDEAVLAAESPESVAQATVEYLSELLPCKRTCVLQFDWERGEGVILAAASAVPTVFTAGRRFPLSGFVGDLEVLRRGELEVADAASCDPQALPQDVDVELKLYGPWVFLNVPLRVSGGLIGALTLGAESRDRITDEWFEVSREVAAVLAVALQQALLRQEIQRHVEELETRVQERTAQLAERVAQVEELNERLERLVEELEAAYRSSEEANRRLAEVNAELEAFTFSVSHDLRAPLRAMSGFAEALLEDYGDRLDDTGQRYLTRIVEAAYRMDRMISDLLTVSRLSRAEIPLGPVALDHAVQEAVQLLREQIRDKGAVVHVEEPMPVVRAHLATLVQVVENLLSNAIKFVAEGVRPEVSIWAELRSHLVRLWVEDNGIGVPPECRERIFQTFERAHAAETYPGSGVGLAIVRRAVTRMGGSVGVEPRPEGGSRFWIELARA